MEALKKNQKRIISPKKAKNIVIAIFIVFIFNFFLFPMPALANNCFQLEEINGESIVIKSNRLGDISDEAVILEYNEPENNLPVNDFWKVKSATIRKITAYNSEVVQCDASPCITANGFDVCEHGKEDTIAANFLKFGTKVKIPELFGDHIFIVRDRMNNRYSDRIDIWMLNKQDAKEFGVKIAKIEILE